MADYCDNCYLVCGHNCGDDCDYNCGLQCNSDCGYRCYMNCQDGCVNGCNDGCTGSCYGTCYGACYESCDQGCGDGCGGGCAAQCSGCGLACGYGCGSGCYQQCANGCTSGCYQICSIGCMHGCGGSCVGTCSNTCTGSCSNTCNNTCSDCTGVGCKGGCEGECLTTCTGGCKTGCEGCTNSCSQGCSDCTSCTSQCAQVCAYDCGQDCNIACTSECLGFCTSICTSSCQLSCNAGCEGECEILCSTICTGFCAEICATSCLYYCTNESFSTAFSKLILFNEYELLVDYIISIYGDENTVKSSANIKQKILANHFIIDLINNVINKRSGFIFNSLSVGALIKIEELIQKITTVEYILRIDEDEAEESLACSYVFGSDAYGMTKGSDNWDSLPIFNEIKPCIFKDGEVVYYLDKNDFTKKEDGTNADLTGTSGDVMIEFPRCAYKIYREDNNSSHLLYISVTNDIEKIKNDKRYNLDAFTRYEKGDLQHFYIGAFLGELDYSKYSLRSLPGVYPFQTRYLDIESYLSYAKNNYSISEEDENYDENIKNNYCILNYTQWKLILCLYLIKYGNRYIEQALGYPATGLSNQDPYVTGFNSFSSVGNVEASIYAEYSTLNKGMNFGSLLSYEPSHLKLFGIEDIVGNLQQIMDGIFIYKDNQDLLHFVQFINQVNNESNKSNFLLNEKINDINTNLESSESSKILSGYWRYMMNSSILAFIPAENTNSYRDIGSWRTSYFSTSAPNLSQLSLYRYGATLKGDYYYGNDAPLFGFCEFVDRGSVQGEELLGVRLCYV